MKDEDAGVPPERQGRGLGHLVGLARRESPWRGTRHLHLATIAAKELPHAYAALRAGKITEHHLTVLAPETTCLTREHREHIDQLVAGDLDALERHTPKTLAAQAAKLAAHIDPEAVVTRRRIAESERHTTLRPAPDTMTWLSAALPVRDGIAVHVTLEQAAVHAQRLGDPRTKGQLMADTLVARLTGHRAQHAGKSGLDTGLVPRPGSTTETSTTALLSTRPGRRVVECREGDIDEPFAEVLAHVRDAKLSPLSSRIEPSGLIAGLIEWSTHRGHREGLAVEGSDDGELAPAHPGSLLEGPDVIRPLPAVDRRPTALRRIGLRHSAQAEHWPVTVIQHGHPVRAHRPGRRGDRRRTGRRRTSRRLVCGVLGDLLATARQSARSHEHRQEQAERAGRGHAGTTIAAPRRFRHVRAGGAAGPPPTYAHR